MTGGGRRNPIDDRQTKKENADRVTGGEKKTDLKIGKKDVKAADQPIGGRTVGTDGAAPGGDHGDRPPRGRAVRKRRRQLDEGSCRSDTM